MIELDRAWLCEVEHGKAVSGEASQGMARQGNILIAAK